MLEHGGRLRAAAQRYGIPLADWLDLSTGINRIAYPVPNLSHHAWTALPTRSDMARLCEAARRHYGTRGSVVPLNGALMLFFFSDALSWSTTAWLRRYWELRRSNSPREMAESPTSWLPRP